MLCSCGYPIWRFAPEPTLSPPMAGVVVPRQAGSWESTEAQGKVAPIAVEVAQVFYEGDYLRVKVRVRVAAALNPQEVAISVQGLREGAVVEEEVQQLSEVVGEGASLVPVESVWMLQFGLSERDLTEYQVRASWGEDAQAMLTRIKADPGVKETFRSNLTAQEVSQELSAEARARLQQASGVALHQSKRSALHLEKVQIEARPVNCRREPCAKYFTVRTVLRNASAEVIEGVRLAVGLYWAEEGEQPRVPSDFTEQRSNEEIIPLDTLTLDPGESKPVNVALDEEVPEVPGGRFVPHLRILSVGVVSPQGEATVKVLR